MPITFIELTQRCESQMAIEVCNGCDACGLRCAAGVPATEYEWRTLTDYIATAPEALRAEMTEGTAFKRTVTEADVVETVLFLCSRAADNLTGQDINVAAGAVMY